MSIKIESDFKDFYDELSNKEAIRVYMRKYSDSRTKIEALRLLRRFGIRTIDIEPVCKRTYKDKELIIYSSNKGYSRKRVVSYEEARLIYNNSLSSVYYGKSYENVLKCLHIGQRRFNIMLRYSIGDLDKYEIKDIVEISKSFGNIGLPIYSIDYININGGMVATELNEVQNLKDIGIDKILSKEDVIKEIEIALEHYNK